MKHPFDLFLPDYIGTIKQHADTERLKEAAPYLLSIVLGMYNSHNICEYCDYVIGCRGLDKDLKEIEDGVLPSDCLCKQCDAIIRYSYGESVGECAAKIPCDAVKTTGLNFIEAVRAAIAGRVVRHDDSEWKWDAQLATLVPIKARVNYPDNELYLAEDWAIVPEPEMMSFPQAVTLLKNGYIMKRRFHTECIRLNSLGIFRVACAADVPSPPYMLELADIQATDWVIVSEAE